MVMTTAELAFREYELLQRAIDKYDNQRTQLRTGSVAIVAGVLSLSATASSVLVACIGVLASLLFLGLEGVLMVIEHDIIQRSNAVEGHLRRYAANQDYNFSEYKFGVSYAFRGTLTFFRWWKVMVQRGRSHIFLFYLALFFVSLSAVGVVLIVG